jgi:hypothetical protein
MNAGLRPNLMNRDNMISGVIAGIYLITISKEGFHQKGSTRKTGSRGQ